MTRRVLLLGASGFIGRSVAASLLERGWSVRGVARDPAGLKRILPRIEAVQADLARDLAPADWSERVRDCEAIVNCAGILRGNLTAVHVEGPRALYEAARKAGVTRAVLVSAISTGAATDYARTKLAGETVLRDSGLAYCVLRPSLVYGEGSYGGTSLLRGLAGFPGLLPIPGNGDARFSPIHLDDLAAMIAASLEGRADGTTLAPCGPGTLTLRELLAELRAWLGFRRAPLLRVPMRLIRVAAKLGDRMGDGPIASVSLAQMEHGNEGDAGPAASATGVTPIAFAAALARRPAQVQDRWHARLYFMRPLVRFVLGASWIFVGLIGLPAAFGGEWPMLPSLLACAWDVALGVAVLRRRHEPSRLALAQIATVLAYTLAASWWAPGLWLDPFGPLLKNATFAVAVLVYAVLEDDR
ncbi:MAG: epimerase [Rhodospirillales bacterium]|nr:epimerase [Rhodospirillales bacterium]